MGDMHDKTGFICPKCGGSNGYWGFRTMGASNQQAEYLICHEDGELMSLPGRDPSVRINEGALEKADRVLPLVFGWAIVALMVTGTLFILFVL